VVAKQWSADSLLNVVTSGIECLLQQVRSKKSVFDKDKEFIIINNSSEVVL